VGPAELVHDPGVAVVELDTIHRFAHDWEADASLALRNGDATAVDTYDRHGRIQATTIKPPPSGQWATKRSKGSSTVATFWSWHRPMRWSMR
jgi:hypothetical protein